MLIKNFNLSRVSNLENSRWALRSLVLTAHHVCQLLSCVYPNSLIFFSLYTLSMWCGMIIGLLWVINKIKQTFFPSFHSTRTTWEQRERRNFFQQFLSEAFGRRNINFSWNSMTATNVNWLKINHSLDGSWVKKFCHILRDFYVLLFFKTKMPAGSWKWQ
jgi:hypothetical protein